MSQGEEGNQPHSINVKSDPQPSPVEMQPINTNPNFEREGTETNLASPSPKSNEELKESGEPKSNGQEVAKTREQIEMEEFNKTLTPNTVLGVTFLLAKTCIGSTIYTLAIRGKQMGLFWLLVFIVIGNILLLILL
ncbi:MAG: hypothetical protein MJ252_05835 [archaeon]|nr:hypothetical protein [archaeon]